MERVRTTLPGRTEGTRRAARGTAGRDAAQNRHLCFLRPRPGPQQRAGTAQSTAGPQHRLRRPIMSKRHHGNPCWYELTTGKGNLQAAENFYRGIFGWEVEGAGMPDFDYRLAKSDGDMVAGLMAMPEDAADITPFWMIYFAVDDADAFVADAKAAGGQLHRGPDDIPGTGRFALLADPQGAGFGIL